MLVHRPKKTIIFPDPNKCKSSNRKKLDSNLKNYLEDIKIFDIFTK